MKPEMDLVLEKADWPALLVDAEGAIVRANAASRRYFGLTEKLSGASLAALWDDGNAISCGNFLKLRTAGEITQAKLRVPGGEKIEVVAHGAKSAQEGKDYIIVQFFKGSGFGEGDAADSRRGIEASVCHKQKLDCALQMARSVALDFNNALTSILGHTSLMLGKAEPDNPWRNSLVEIEKSAAKAAEIANDLAAFSRQEKDVRAQMAGNLNMLLDRTVEIFQGTTQAPITISRQLERRLFTASFDEAKMQQALVKIFENAVEAIKGEGRISVRTRNFELTEPTQDRTAKLNPGNYVCVEVADTGSGIAPDVMPHIFEPFFTTKGTRHRGLGLAWVYGIVTNHGGGVAISSQPGIGTTVRLYLPASTRIVREAPVADYDLNGSATILLVDDEDLLLTMGRMVLSSYGYTVLTANSGHKAIEIFSQSKKKIDLVITDLVMPNMSGRELSEHILQGSPETRVLYCSGYVRSNSHEQESYLQKPFTAQDLLRKVKQVLAE